MHFTSAQNATGCSRRLSDRRRISAVLQELAVRQNVAKRVWKLGSGSV